MIKRTHTWTEKEREYTKLLATTMVKYSLPALSAHFKPNDSNEVASEMCGLRSALIIRFQALLCFSF